jgi:superfamily II DNA or RNA helicase
MCIVFIEDSFEQKLFKVVDRKDFEEKWRNEMAKFLIEHAMKAKHGDEFFTEQATKAKHEDETPHQKTASETKDNGGNAKMDEVLEQVCLMMRKVINIETLIKNPLAKLDI